MAITMKMSLKCLQRKSKKDFMKVLRQIIQRKPKIKSRQIRMKQSTKSTKSTKKRY